MTQWQPITEDALLKRIAQGEARMSVAQARLWNAVRVQPQRWQQDPYGIEGNGFWVVGLIGKTVIWYNDREDGFNRSRYLSHGTIEDYWCNQDELEITVGYLVAALEKGPDLVLMRRPAERATP
ncbi:MAG: hypothetical protein C0506_16770 [Anaerolinea sp.]|nr:hypothetical protein [Anaerolinea sp.]